MAPHELDVRFFDFRRREREFLCISEHGGASIVKSGRRPVGLDAGQEVVIVQQATQTAPMVHDSVATTIQLADAQRDQLAVHLAQALGATHDGFIEAEVGFEPFRVQRVDPQDVVDPPRIGVLHAVEEPVAAAFGLVPDPGHVVFVPADPAARRVERAAPGDSMGFRLEVVVGHVDKIWVKRAKLGAMDGRDTVDLVVGQGIPGNADVGGKRQVTILDAARWAETCARLGREVDAAARRANLLVSGVELRGSKGRRLVIGACVVLVNGETAPCRRIDGDTPGIMDALKPDWAGGVYGQVVVGGSIAVGDPVAFEAE